MKRECSVLFLGKADDDHVNKALDFCRRNFTDVSAFLGKWGEKLPAEVENWDGDYVISYLSRWIIPERILSKAKVAAINFHPASPDYPGFGCNNFALYEEAEEYGATCHHMASKVDTGAIIAVKRFPVFPTDTVASMHSRTYDNQLVLFYEVVGTIIKGEELPASKETWTREPFTRKQFNELDRLTPDMSAEEMAKRIRATTFGPWKPKLMLNGITFEPQVEE